VQQWFRRILSNIHSNLSIDSALTANMQYLMVVTQLSDQADNNQEFIQVYTLVAGAFLILYILSAAMIPPDTNRIIYSA